MTDNEKETRPAIVAPICKYCRKPAWLAEDDVPPMCCCVSIDSNRKDVNIHGCKIEAERDAAFFRPAEPSAKYPRTNND